MLLKRTDFSVNVGGTAEVVFTDFCPFVDRSLFLYPFFERLVQND